MTIFTSLDNAVRAGFHWLEFNSALDLHLVQRDFTREDGKKVRALAYARAEVTPLEV